MEKASNMIPIMSVPCNMVSFMILSLVFLYTICVMKINVHPNRNASSCAKRGLVIDCHIKIDATSMAVETIMYHATAFCSLFSGQALFPYRWRRSKVPFHTPRKKFLCFSFFRDEEGAISIFCIDIRVVMNIFADRRIAEFSVVIRE